MRCHLHWNERMNYTTIASKMREHDTRPCGSGMQGTATHSEQPELQQLTRHFRRYHTCRRLTKTELLRMTLCVLESPSPSATMLRSPRIVSTLSGDTVICEHHDRYEKPRRITPVDCDHGFDPANAM